MNRHALSGSNPTPIHASHPSLQWALGSAGHAVQFYQNESYLREVAVHFLADGLRSGQPALAVATSEHRLMFERGLRDQGFDVAALSASGALVLLDARRVLAQIMVGDSPDPDRFRDVIGRLLHRLGGRRRVVRAYGEMVDVIWRDGNPPAALRLEQLWNVLAARYHFALLCGYSIDNFMNAEHATLFEDVCGEHHHVVPTERPPAR